jgi:hypothetical protein
LLFILGYYLDYFNTPYFIFVRDTLSYLALLGLHFAVCLQPSKLRPTVSEWLILAFFLGRLLMEIDQVISGMRREKRQAKSVNIRKEEQVSSVKIKEENPSDSSSGGGKRQQTIMKQLSKYFR